VFEATQSTPFRKIASSNRASFVSIRFADPCCTAPGGIESVGILRSVVVKLTPLPTPGVPCNTQIRVILAGPRLASGTAAMNNVQGEPAHVDDSDSAGWIESSPCGAPKNLVLGLVMLGFIRSFLFTTRNSVPKNWLVELRGSAYEFPVSTSLS